MSNFKNKRIITVATTGAWPQKEDNPHVPLTPEEISEDDERQKRHADDYKQKHRFASDFL